MKHQTTSSLNLQNNSQQRMQQHSNSQKQIPQNQQGPIVLQPTTQPSARKQPARVRKKVNLNLQGMVVVPEVPEPIHQQQLPKQHNKQAMQNINSRNQAPQDENFNNQNHYTATASGNPLLNRLNVAAKSQRVLSTKRPQKLVHSATTYHSPKANIEARFSQMEGECEDLGHLKKVQKARQEIRLRELQRKRQTQELRVDVDQILDKDASRPKKRKNSMAAKGGQSRNLFPTEASAKYQKPFGKNLVADEDILRAYTVNSSDLEDFGEERKVGTQSNEYGPNGNNENIVLLSSYENLYTKAKNSENAASNWTPMQTIPTETSPKQGSIIDSRKQRQMLTGGGSSSRNFAPRIDQVFSATGRDYSNQQQRGGKTATMTNLNLLKNLNEILEAQQAPDQNKNSKHRKMPQSARTSRPESRTAILNQDLHQYFLNKKDQKAMKQRYQPVVLTRSKSKSKQPSQATSMLWVESLYTQLKHASSSQSKSKDTNNLTPSHRCTSALQKEEDNLIITGVGYWNSGAAQTQMRMMTEPSEALPHNTQAAKLRNQTDMSRSKSRNTNDIYDAPGKPEGELHKYLSQEQFRLKSQQLAHQQSEQKVLRGAKASMLTKSRTNKLFQILTNGSSEKKAGTSQRNLMMNQNPLQESSRPYGGGKAAASRNVETNRANSMNQFVDVMSNQQKQSSLFPQQQTERQQLHNLHRKSGSSLALKTPKTQKQVHIRNSQILHTEESQVSLKTNQLSSEQLLQLKPQTFTLSDKLLGLKSILKKSQ